VRNNAEEGDCISALQDRCQSALSLYCHPGLTFM